MRRRGSNSDSNAFCARARRRARSVSVESAALLWFPDSLLDKHVRRRIPSCPPQPGSIDDPGFPEPPRTPIDWTICIDEKGNIERKSTKPCIKMKLESTSSELVLQHTQHEGVPTLNLKRTKTEDDGILKNCLPKIVENSGSKSDIKSIAPLTSNKQDDNATAYLEDQAQNSAYQEDIFNPTKQTRSQLDFTSSSRLEALFHTNESKLLDCAQEKSPECSTVTSSTQNLKNEPTVAFTFIQKVTEDVESANLGNETCTILQSENTERKFIVETHLCSENQSIGNKKATENFDELHTQKEDIAISSSQKSFDELTQNQISYMKSSLTSLDVSEIENKTTDKNNVEHLDQPLFFSPSEQESYCSLITKSQSLNCAKQESTDYPKKQEQTPFDSTSSLTQACCSVIFYDSTSNPHLPDSSCTETTDSPLFLSLPSVENLDVTACKAEDAEPAQVFVDVLNQTGASASPSNFVDDISETFDFAENTTQEISPLQNTLQDSENSIKGTSIDFGELEQSENTVKPKKSSDHNLEALHSEPLTARKEHCSVERYSSQKNLCPDAAPCTENQCIHREKILPSANSVTQIVDGQTESSSRSLDFIGETKPITSNIPLSALPDTQTSFMIKPEDSAKIDDIKGSNLNEENESDAIASQNSLVIVPVYSSSRSNSETLESSYKNLRLSTPDAPNKFKCEKLDYYNSDQLSFGEQVPLPTREYFEQTETKDTLETCKTEAVENWCRKNNVETSLRDIFFFDIEEQVSIAQPIICVQEQPANSQVSDANEKTREPLFESVQSSTAGKKNFATPLDLSVSNSTYATFLSNFDTVTLQESTNLTTKLVLENDDDSKSLENQKSSASQPSYAVLTPRVTVEQKINNLTPSLEQKNEDEARSTFEPQMPLKENLTSISATSDVLLSENSSIQEPFVKKPSLAPNFNSGYTETVTVSENHMLRTESNMEEKTQKKSECAEDYPQKLTVALSKPFSVGDQRETVDSLYEKQNEPKAIEAKTRQETQTVIEKHDKPSETSSESDLSIEPLRIPLLEQSSSTKSNSNISTFDIKINNPIVEKDEKAPGYTLNDQINVDNNESLGIFSSDLINEPLSASPDFTINPSATIVLESSAPDYDTSQNSNFGSKTLESQVNQKNETPISSQTGPLNAEAQSNYLYLCNVIEEFSDKLTKPISEHNPNNLLRVSLISVAYYIVSSAQNSSERFQCASRYAHQMEVSNMFPTYSTAMTPLSTLKSKNGLAKKDSFVAWYTEVCRSVNRVPLHDLKEIALGNNSGSTASLKTMINLETTAINVDFLIIAQALWHPSPQLVALALSNVDLTCEALDCLLGAVLASQPQITYLNLSGNPELEAGISNIAFFIRFSRNLRRLDLTNINISETGATELAKAVLLGPDGRGSTLLQLAITTNAMSSMPYLFNAIRKSNIFALELQDCFQSDDDLSSLSFLFNTEDDSKEKNNTYDPFFRASVLGLRKNAINRLNLSENNISQNGASVIASFLKYSKDLRALNLSGNCIGASGAVMIIEAATNLDVLQELLLCRNDLNDEEKENMKPKVRLKQQGLVFAERLSNYLKKTCSLRVIGLSRCNLGDEQLLFVASGLLGNQTLRKVSIQDNNLSEEMASVVATAIEAAIRARVSVPTGPFTSVLDKLDSLYNKMDISATAVIASQVAELSLTLTQAWQFLADLTRHFPALCVGEFPTYLTKLRATKHFTGQHKGMLSNEAISTQILQMRKIICEQVYSLPFFTPAEFVTDSAAAWNYMATKLLLATVGCQDCQNFPQTRNEASELSLPSRKPQRRQVKRISPLAQSEFDENDD